VTRFVTRNGHLKAVGHLSGTLTKKSGATKAVSERVRMPVNMSATRAANTTSALPTTSSTASTSAVSCDVLHLVLGPLDLDLLGLVVHLDKVVLDITASPAPAPCWATCSAPWSACSTAPASAASAASSPTC
jgi:hypothetical protein